MGTHPIYSSPFLQALSNQQKAVLMSERVMGIEHPNTIQEYVSGHWARAAQVGGAHGHSGLTRLSLQMHLALYCFASSQLSTALSLLYRARYLTLLVFGEDHPEMALLDVSAEEGWRGEPQPQGSGS